MPKQSVTYLKPQGKLLRETERTLNDFLSSVRHVREAANFSAIVRNLGIPKRRIPVPEDQVLRCLEHLRERARQMESRDLYFLPHRASVDIIRMPLSVKREVEYKMFRKSDPHLRRLYCRLNRRHFASRLPQDIVVGWMQRPRGDDTLGYSTAYSCRHMRPLILLHRGLRDKRDHLICTLLHEAVHLRFGSHGPDFRKEMRRLERVGACRIPRYRYELRTKKGEVLRHGTFLQW